MKIPLSTLFRCFSAPSVRRSLVLFPFFFGLAAFAEESDWSHVAVGDEADEFFDDSYVHNIYLTFADDDWFDVLEESHSNDPDDPYFEASFSADGVEITSVGVRFKGNSSFSGSSVKKSLKIDFDEYDEENDDLTFFGLKKLNLNNNYNDPSQMREKLVLDFASNFVKGAGRAVHTNVYVNGELLGLYTAVEQVDKTYVQSRFGSDEDGNLYKGSASDDLDDASQSDFGSDLTYLGTDASLYESFYKLKTNETANDYTNLVEFIDVLNNTSAADLPDALEPLLDVPDALASMAINILFANIDSYSGSAHNYYLYERDDTGLFTHILWDLNESFGTFSLFTSSGDTMTTLSPFWMPVSETVVRPGQPSEEEERPLMENLWAVDEYSQEYLRDLAAMLREGFDQSSALARVTTLADIIRDDVYADPNKQYTSAQFETNLTGNVTSSRSTIYGITSFINSRANYLSSTLDGYASTSDLRLNEVMVDNAETVQDEAGDYEPWLEIYNPGPGLVTVSGLYLTDDANDLTQWSVPSISLDDGEFLTVWLDGETGEGSYHASFFPAINGGSLYLTDGSAIIDSLTYEEMASDESWARLPDGEGDFALTDQPSYGSSNIESSIGDAPTGLFINELMADNETTVEDPDDAGSFEDWVELYNASSETIDLSGMYLTDDTSDPTQWQFTEGTTIEPGEYLLIWTDDDTDQGDTHTSFKLSSGGETVALYHVDGVTLVDSVVFGALDTDASYGRILDGGEDFATLSTPTPGSSNVGEGDLELTIESGFEGGSYVVSFESSANYVYTLWRSADLTDDSWSAVTGQVAIAGTGSNATLTDSAPPADQAFYRVTAELAN